MNGEQEGIWKFAVVTLAEIQIEYLPTYKSGALLLHKPNFTRQLQSV
jgi:hypothetical protein